MGFTWLTFWVVANLHWLLQMNSVFHTSPVPDRLRGSQPANQSTSLLSGANCRAQNYRARTGRPLCPWEKEGFPSCFPTPVPHCHSLPIVPSTHSGLPINNCVIPVIHRVRGTQVSWLPETFGGKEKQFTWGNIL